ncbi:hypothetical protein HPB52_016058 [Rhipicephalus sanguineus]|uniref:Uncharacterized protein n=1 Tax=Rhipicephalus sanguineus TaxID=34632 RepID=A0A9D4PM34_RHISA|nr:hypothetical protein HPB52_016058 [Rhipicephalus sanguineus]
MILGTKSRLLVKVFAPVDEGSSRDRLDTTFAQTPDHHGVPSQPLRYDERTKERPRRKLKYRRLPPLPRDDFKVIVMPHQDLPIKSVTSPTLADAAIAACGGLITVNAYVATGEGAIRGVIHGLQPHTPSKEIKANLRVRTQGVEILQARMLGDTKTATTSREIALRRGGANLCAAKAPKLSTVSTYALATRARFDNDEEAAPLVQLGSRTPGCHKARTPGHPRFPRPEEVKRADAASPSAPMTNNPEYRQIVAENKLLRGSLAEIKKELASLKAHQRQTPQKQLRHPAKSNSRKRTNDSPSSPASRRPKQADAADIATIHHGESTAHTRKPPRDLALELPHLS